MSANLKFRREAIVIFFFLIIQGCSQGEFETSNKQSLLSTEDLGDTGENYDDSILSDVGANNPIVEISNGRSSGSPSSRSAGNPLVQNPKGESGVAPEETCNDIMQVLGYDSFVGALNIDLNPADDMSLTGSEPYAYMGFGITIHGKVSTNEEKYTKLFNITSSGFSIKLTDMLSSRSLTVADSLFAPIPSLSPIEKNGSAAVSTYSANPKWNSKRINFKIKNDFYFSNSDFGLTKIELYCHNSIVGSGIQDFKSLEYPLNLKYKKVSSGGYTFKDSVVGFINLSCPKEAVAETPVSCSAGGLGLENIYWLVNGVREPYFNGTKVISYTRAPAGVHTVQAISILSNGKEMRSLINTVEIK